MVNDYLKNLNLIMKAVPQAAFLLWARMPVKMCFYTRLKCSPAIQTKISCPGHKTKGRKVQFLLQYYFQTGFIQYLKRNKLKRN